MKLLMCFGGAAAVADDEAAAEAAARRRDQRGRRSLSFRGKFLSGNKGSKKQTKSPPAESKKRGMDADDVAYVGDVFGPSTASSSVASSALLSSAASLDSGYSSSSSSSRSSSASSSASASGVLFPPAAKRQQAKKRSSPVAGVAAVVLCLLMVVFCGRVGATLLTSTALYLFPRRWPARTAREKDEVASLESDAEEETTARRKVVMDQGFLMRNRKK